jgi:hypothetical protein
MAMDLGNGAAGIADFQALATIIYHNVIAGNADDGIWLNGSTYAGLNANLIGVDQNGSIALPNGLAGIAITDGANGNTIGDPTDVSARNVISGNTLCGVDINSGATNNLLNGNYIGLGASGLVAIPNSLAGVCFNGASDNTLSSSTATVSQFISGNTRQGVYVLNSSFVGINNATLIGVAGDGSSALGNGLHGIFLDTGTTGAIIHPGQVGYNGGAGIVVVGDSSISNAITPGAVGSNTGLGIDLGNDGHTANDTGDGDSGPNNLLNFPEVNTIVPGSFTGMACPGCRVYIYAALGNPTANGGGGVVLGFVDADAVTGDFSYTFPGGVTAVTMQACDTVAQDCSEFSPSVVNPGAPALRFYLPVIVK